MAKRRLGSDRHGSQRLTYALVAAIALIALAVVVWGAVAACTRLADVCDESCRVADADYDVIVSSGRMVSADVIVSHFGLTNGANLARIDFASLRRKLLDKVPNIRELRVERRLPNRVTVEVVEREPVARVTSGNGAADGRVTDAEGVVFVFARGIATLPVIREGGVRRTKPGERLRGMSAAALRLVTCAADEEFARLNVQEVDVSRSDYLTVTLGDYSRAKVAWQHMESRSQSARESLLRQLRRLTHCIRSDVAAGSKLWNATDYGDAGRVYANDPARALSQTPERSN